MLSVYIYILLRRDALNSIEIYNISRTVFNLPHDFPIRQKSTERNTFLVEVPIEKDSVRSSVDDVR